MINVAELLKDAPYGTELWCTLYGKVYFISIDLNKRYPIQIRLNDNTKVRLDRYGKYYDNFEQGECILFPSKDCRTWKGWKLPVEHKFRVGDWITDGTCKVKITDINNNYYWFSKNCILGKIESVDKKCRLWTIQDAKDGDVLISRTGNPFIYNGNSEFSAVGAYIGVSQNGKIMLDMFPSRTWTSTIGIKPATKEECELLFDKIKEIGYEWDDDNKELKKIQNHYDISNFYAGMPVLVRWYDTGKWRYSLYSFYEEDSISKFDTVKGSFTQCIPFNDGTKHLLGTTDMCPEEYINW